MFTGMRNYLIVGLYRNGHIGDPNLLWPNGTPVYGKDGAPGVVYLDGFIAGKTQASVLSERPWGPQPVPPPPPPPADVDAGVADAGTPVADPDDAGVSVTSPAQPQQPAPKTGLAGIGYPSGCSSRGSPLAWMAVPLLAGLALRRRKARRG